MMYPQYQDYATVVDETHWSWTFKVFAMKYRPWFCYLWNRIIIIAFVFEADMVIKSKTRAKILSQKLKRLF